MNNRETIVSLVVEPIFSASILRGPELGSGECKFS